MFIGFLNKFLQNNWIYFCKLEKLLIFALRMFTGALFYT